MIFLSLLFFLHAEMSPIEDLMREHGVLNRILLIYEAMVDNDSLDSGLITRSATIMKEFIEEHHEIMEETQIFSRFEKANLMVDLVATLKEQHIAGRLLTNYLIEHASELQNPEVKAAIKKTIQIFRPHAAQEDTVLFPAFYTLVTEEELEELAELCEEEEEALLGPNGFSVITDELTSIEKQLGINYLDQFGVR